MRSISLVRAPTFRAPFGSSQKPGRDCLSSSSASSLESFGRSKKPPERGEAVFEAIDIESLQVGEYGLVRFFHKSAHATVGAG